MCGGVDRVRWGGHGNGERDDFRHMTDKKFCCITLNCSLRITFNQEKVEGKRMILKRHFQS